MIEIKETINLNNKIVKILFPQYCISCGKFGNYLCNRCLYTFSQNLPECYLCRKVSQNSKAHKSCKKPTGIQIEGVISLYQYTDSARKLMQKFKYEGAYMLQDTIDKMIVSKLKIINKFITSKKSQQIYLIPIPLHPKRQLKRGYNQAELIAQILENNKIGTINDNLLSKTSNSKTQVSNDKSLRKKTLNPFIARKLFNINSKDILLIIDDVMTTGTTVSQATKAISKIYTNKTYALTLFRPTYRGGDLKSDR